MKDVLISTIGDYLPAVTDGWFATLDVPWILSAVLLVVLVYCLFRFLGGIFR